MQADAKFRMQLLWKFG